MLRHRAICKSEADKIVRHVPRVSDDRTSKKLSFSEKYMAREGGDVLGGLPGHEQGLSVFGVIK